MRKLTDTKADEEATDKKTELKITGVIKGWHQNGC